MEGRRSASPQPFALLKADYSQCETDLPKNIRLGKVRVSCEGWSAAGDKSVLQGKLLQTGRCIKQLIYLGSCGLEYNLHSVNRGLEYGEDPQIPRSNDQLLSSLFLLVFVFIGGVIIYSLIRSCLQRHAPRYTPPPFPWGGGGGDGPGFGGGGPPPPYTKQPENTGMGLGTAAGLGALGGAAAMGASQLLSPRPYRQEPRMREVDRSDERGEGSSNGMRRATGFGGSSSR